MKDFAEKPGQTEWALGLRGNFGPNSLILRTLCPAVRRIIWDDEDKVNLPTITAELVMATMLSVLAGSCGCCWCLWGHQNIKNNSAIPSSKVALTGDRNSDTVSRGPSHLLIAEFFHQIAALFVWARLCQNNGRTSRAPDHRSHQHVTMISFGLF